MSRNTFETVVSPALVASAAATVSTGLGVSGLVRGMREPVISVRSVVGTVCAMAGTSAKAQNAPPANNCPAASGNAFILEDGLTPFGRNFIEFKFLWSKFETIQKISRFVRDRRTSDSDVTAMRFPAATKTCSCYNCRNEVVANLSLMRGRDAQATDSSEIAQRVDIRLAMVGRTSRSSACTVHDV
jgi:hypothetical protein